MTTEIKVPVLPESVADATIATWHVKAGDTVSRDQNLVDIETDKVVLEVVAPEDGVISEILFQEGDTVLGEQLIANLTSGGAAAVPAATATPAVAAPAASGPATDIKVPVLPESVADATIATWHVKVGEAVEQDQNLVDIETDKVVLEVVAPSAGVLSEILFEEGATVLAEQAIAKFVAGAVAAAAPVAAAADSGAESDALSPSVRRLLAEKGLDAASIKGTGKGGRVTKDDVEKSLKSVPAAKAASTTTEAPAVPMGERTEKRVPMTRLRKTIANRLLQAKNSTAMLTTFNEINMKQSWIYVSNTKKALKSVMAFV